MQEMAITEQDRRQDFLFSVALCLIAAVVLTIAGAVLRSGTFSGASARVQIEEISEQYANIVTAALVLAAVVALSFLAPARLARARPLVVIAFIVGAVVALLATYSVVDILSLHVPGPNSTDSISIGITPGLSFADRLGTVLPAVGTVLIALVAMVTGNRLGNPMNDD